MNEMRYDLRRNRPGPLWFLGLTAVPLLFVIINDGFSWGMILVMPVVMVVAFGSMEIGLRRHNYAIFHNAHVDIRRVDMGDRFGAPKLSIPYHAIRSALVNMEGVVELELQLDVLAEKQAGGLKKHIRNWETDQRDDGQPILLLRARDPHRLAGEFTARVGVPASSVG